MKSVLISSAVFLAVCLILEPAAAQSIQIHLPSKATPLTNQAVQIFSRRVKGRCGAQVTTPAIQVIARSGTGESYTIANGARGSVVVTGTERGVLYGLGKLFRDSHCEAGVLKFGAWRGTSSPAGAFRGIYLASHFGNFYEAAPNEELQTYVEDLALWGVNAVGFAFPNWQYTSFDDPAARANLTRILAMMKTAKSAGMKVGAMVAPNQVFKTAPKELLAKPFPDDLKRRGNLGTNMCPSIPAGRKYMLENWTRLLNEYSGVGLDFVVYWPYDEGGCGCDQCWPWGSRGFSKLGRDFTETARKKYPRIETVLSTWMFDTPQAGEWDGLTQLLAKDKSWVNYIMADAHEDYPRYPLDKGVPGNLPLVNFPEISMWGMSPWGGYGANPLLNHSQMLWDQVKAKVRGGLPYSEGIYEDLNKVVYSQFYWDPQRTAVDTAKEYISSEFSPAVVNDVLRAMEIMETNHRRRRSGFEKPPQQTAEAYALMRASDAKLHDRVPEAWRWRILYLRALIDDELSKTSGKPRGLVLRDAFAELVRIYHAEHVHTNKVAPPDLLP